MSEKKVADMIDFTGKVAIVTGAASGLGQAICEGLAEHGADVCGCDIDMEGLEQTEKMVTACGHRWMKCQVDVSDYEQVADMVQKVLDNFGTIDILYSNVGIAAIPVPLHEYPVDQWDRLIDINLNGMFYCMRAVLPTMVEKKSGVIVLTGSISGLGTYAQPPEVACYGAAKAGVEMLTRYAARQYAPYGIRVNSFAPGVHATKGFNESPYRTDPELLAALHASIPMGRHAEAEEIKGVALFLGSDASSFVTGVTIPSDGGARA